MSSPDEAREALEIGFVGIGRVGLPFATLLIEAGHSVVCCRRGRSNQLVSRGARIAGDGSPRAVAEAADIVFTCLPGDGLRPAFTADDGILAAPDPMPIVIEMSTASLIDKQTLRARIVQRGGELLDCPVSGTPEMAAKRAAVVFASGDRATYERVVPLLGAISPGQTYVGELGAGTKIKYVANLLVAVHVTAAAEAMAFADALGLDLHIVAELLSRSPAATSGQFQVRAPMIAAEDFEGRLVTIADIREVLGQICAAAADAGASVPLASVSKELFDRHGDDGSDPGRLAVLLNADADAAASNAADPPPPRLLDPEEEARLAHIVSTRVARMLGTRLYVGISTVRPLAPAPPVDVIKEHLEWAQGLERRGVLFAAGPFVDDDGGILGDGMFVIRADSAAHAERVFAEDPIHVEGFRRFTVHGWVLHEGTLNISINLSDRTYALV